MNKLFLICVLLSLSISMQPSQPPAASQPATASDLGYMFHNGTHLRPHAHNAHAQSTPLPENTIITAQTDDQSQPNNQESRIALIQQAPPGIWSVDFATIKPESISFNSQEKAQQFARNFLSESSTLRKEQEAMKAAQERKDKRKRMKTQKYRL